MKVDRLVFMSMFVLCATERDDEWITAWRLQCRGYSAERTGDDKTKHGEQSRFAAVSCKRGCGLREIHLLKIVQGGS